MCTLVAQLYRTFCDPMACSPPCSSVHGILQARMLKCGAIPFHRGSSGHRDRTHISCIAGRYFIVWATGEAQINKYFFKKIRKKLPWLTWELWEFMSFRIFPCRSIIKNKIYAESRLALAIILISLVKIKPLNGCILSSHSTESWIMGMNKKAFISPIYSEKLLP